MAKKHKAPPGIDYDPITGDTPDVSYGIVEAEAGRTLDDVLFKRFYPTHKPDPTLPWPPPSAERWEILLPPGAPDEFSDPQRLCRAYHRNDQGSIQHLAAVVTIRHPETDIRPQRMRLHEAWSLGRALGVSLGLRFDAAVVAAFHVPGRAWGQGVPHTHLVCPVRTIRPGSGFTTFIMPLINAAEGRTIIDAEYEKVREALGYVD